MTERKLVLSLVLLAWMSGMASPAQSEELLIAVASNFAPAMEQIARDFEQETGHRVVLSAGASGRHFAQISNGAPYDAFFAADAERPRMLEEAGIGVAGSRFSYAMGRLVLWSPDPLLLRDGAEVLKSTEYRFLAMANPRLAPYGLAAEQVLDALGLTERLQREGRIVRGENIAQTFQFIQSGNAALGFVAWSQVIALTPADRGSLWQVPASMHAPIEQQAILLRDRPAARQFMNHLQSEAVRAVIDRFGYGLP